MSETPEKLKSTWKAFLGYGLAAVALGIFFGGNHSISDYKARSAASQKWPTVKGIIIKSLAEERYSTDSDGDTSVSYAAVIEYAYAVDGVFYTHDQLGWEDYMYRDTMEAAQRFADTYPAGTTVIVHYDPEKPDFALLDTTLPDRPGDAGIGYFIGSGAVLAIAAALIYAQTGMLYRIPGGALIAISMVVFIGGAILTASLGPQLAVLPGFGFVSFAVGAIVRGRR